LPPTTPNITTFTRTEFTFTYGTDFEIPDADKLYMLYISKPLLPSQISRYNKYKLIAVEASTGFTQSIVDYYKDLFGILPEIGQYVNTKIALYDKINGTFGAFSEQRTIIS